jgi:hypothetical protein
MTSAGIVVNISIDTHPSLPPCTESLTGYKAEANPRTEQVPYRPTGHGKVDGISGVRPLCDNLAHPAGKPSIRGNWKPALGL